MNIPDWNLLRTFIAVSEAGTLTGAADALKTTQPTVGRHIRELEALVGETLFDRLPGGMRATDKALDLLASVMPMRDGAAAFGSVLKGAQAQLSGTVRIAANESVGAIVLPGLLARLMADEPGLQVELVLSDRVENLLLREADIAVRFFRPSQEDLITASLGEAQMGLYAHDLFIERVGLPTSTDDLLGHLIGEDDLTRTFRVTQAAGLELKRSDFCFRTDGELALLAAVEQGIGIGPVWTYLARRNPRLHRVFHDRLNYRVTLWLCAHEDLRRSARLRRVFDHLAQSLRLEFAQADD